MSEINHSKAYEKALEAWKEGPGAVTRGVSQAEYSGSQLDLVVDNSVEFENIDHASLALAHFVLDSQIYITRSNRVSPKFINSKDGQGVIGELIERFDLTPDRRPEVIDGCNELLSDPEGIPSWQLPQR